MEKTYTQRMIELGQDINNAWQVIAPRNVAADDLPTVFKATFRQVRELSNAARDEAARELVARFPEGR